MSTINNKFLWEDNGSTTTVPEVKLYDGVKVKRSLVTTRYIKDNCIAIDPVFYITNKTTRNSLRSFVLPKENLRSHVSILSFPDFVKDEGKILEGYNYIKETAMNYDGCFITSHGVYWEKLVRELLQAKKHVYVNLAYGQQNVHVCSLV